MSKDRQQRRDVSVVRTGDQIVASAQPGATGADVEAAVAEHDAARDAATDPFFVRRDTFAGPPRNITINVTANGTEDPEQLSQAILRQVHAQLIMAQDRPAKPAANIPKAIHHLRRAANALPGDALREAIEGCIFVILGVPMMPERVTARPVQVVLPDIAAALDLDVHAAAIAKDVRAASEALS